MAPWLDLYAVCVAAKLNGSNGVAYSPVELAQYVGIASAYWSMRDSSGLEDYRVQSMFALGM